MTIYIAYGDDGRVGAYTTYGQYANGMTAVEAPEGFDPETSDPTDYVYADGVMTYDPLPEPPEPPDPVAIATEAKEMARTAQATADEAKDAAAQAGTDPQLQALATLQVQTMDLAPLPASDLAAFRDYWPEWKPDTQYKQNDPLRYKGVYYRVSQDTTSSDVYPPDTAVESLYYPVTIAPDGIIVYRECHGEYDMVRKGETRHYPDAEGPVYLAKVDTAYDPDTVPGNWELVE